MMSEFDLGYALAKQVPDLASGVTFETNYGRLHLDQGDSRKVAALVEKLLRKKQSQLHKNYGPPAK